MAKIELSNEQIKSLVKQLTSEQKLALVEEMGWQQEKDNQGQILFYTGLKYRGAKLILI